MTGPQVFRVALDMPLRRVFDYLPPKNPAPDATATGAASIGASKMGTPAIEPGTRVRVPFGRQRLVGIVLETGGSSDLPSERLKSILEVLDPRPILDTAALGLLRWAAEYYHHPIGEVISAALPKALVERNRAGTRSPPARRPKTRSETAQAA